MSQGLQIPATLWREELAQAFRRSSGLLDFLQLSPHFASLEAERDFPTLVTQHYATLMEKGNLRDPLLLQVLAQSSETLVVPGFVADPVEDSCATQVEGVLQKYAGRILVMPTGACAIHCRHCFRRAFPYESLQTQGLALRLQDFLAQHSDIEEVILSGGDPLLLDDESLSVILGVIAMAPSVRRLRIHTRVPIVLPNRFTQTLLEMLTGLPCETILVVHANHANELDEASALVFARLRGLGVHLLNQSVLLQGVNDSAQVLADLSRKLFAQGVLPYYLHQLDRAAGTAHFEVPVSQGLAIMEQLGAMLPGYLVPRYVREVPGASGKTILVAC